MPSTQRTPPQTCSFYGSLLLAIVPTASAAALETVKVIDLESGRWWAVLLFVQVITLVGYAASSLSQWAGWIDGTILQRLTIMQGMFAALLAGNMSYFLGLHYAGLSEIMAMMASGAGGYGGDRYLVPMFQKLLGRLTDQPREKP